MQPVNKHPDVKLGLHMSPPGQNTSQIDRGAWAEAHGFDSLWIPDGLGRMDAFTMAAGIAPQTRDIRLCLGIVPVYTRPAAVIATSTMTMTHLAPNRFVLGLGASSHTMVESWYGMPYEKPLSRVRETTELVRQMLSGERTRYTGTTIRSENFRLGIAPAADVPIHLAALRPKMLELAGEIADGVILNLVPLELLPRILEHIDTGAKRSGRRVENLDISVYLYAFSTADEAAAESDMAAIAAGYFSTPVYSDFLKWMGYAAQAELILQGFKERDRSKTLGAFTPEVLHKLAIIGDPQHCWDALKAYADAGVTVPVVAAAASDHAMYEQTLMTLARP